MYWPNFWLPTDREQQNTFEKTHIELCSPYLHASFGAFCVQIGQLFEAQWAFEELNTYKTSFSKENVADFEFLRMFKGSLYLE